MVGNAETEILSDNFRIARYPATVSKDKATSQDLFRDRKLFVTLLLWVPRVTRQPRSP